MRNAYARLAQFPVKPGSDNWADGIAEQFNKIMKGQPGFRNATFLHEEGTNVYGALSVWESREAAEEAGNVLQATIREHATEHLTGPPTVTLFEVYGPQE